jgi:uncharacterized protein YxeA
MEELHGIFIAYEMRIEQENPYIKEASSNHPKGQRKRENKKKKNIAVALTPMKAMKKWPIL